MPLKPHRNLTHEERLLAYLFRDYDPVARAVVDTDKPVDVYLAFVLLRIHGLVSINLFYPFFSVSIISSKYSDRTIVSN